MHMTIEVPVPVGRFVSTEGYDAIRELQSMGCSHVECRGGEIEIRRFVDPEWISELKFWAVTCTSCNQTLRVGEVSLSYIGRMFFISGKPHLVEGEDGFNLKLTQAGSGQKGLLQKLLQIFGIPKTYSARDYFD